MLGHPRDAFLLPPSQRKAGRSALHPVSVSAPFLLLTPHPPFLQKGRSPSATFYALLDYTAYHDIRLSDMHRAAVRRWSSPSTTFRISYIVKHYILYIIVVYNIINRAAVRRWSSPSTTSRAPCPSPAPASPCAPTSPE